MDDFDDLLYERIEKYLRRQMSREENASFEAEIAADEYLAEMVNLHRLEQEQRELILKNQLREQFETWRKTQPLEEKRRRWWLWLLPVLLLSILAWRYFTTAEPVSLPPVIQEPVVPPDSNSVREPMNTDSAAKNPIAPPGKSDIKKPIVLSTNVVDDTRLAILDEDLKNFSPMNRSSSDKGNDIQEFIDLYGGLDLQHEDYNQTRLALGRAYIHTKNYPKAKAIFTELMTKYDPRTQTYKRAEWYITLMLLSDFQANRAEIKDHLENMESDPNHPFGPEIIRLRAAVNAQTSGKR